MTPNTPENRKLFYSQYYGQKVLFDREWDDWQDNLLTLTGEALDYSNNTDCIALFSLSTITDEDAIEVANLHDFSKGFKGSELDFVVQKVKEKPESFSRVTKIADFLRSKSYLVDFRDLTPERLINYGWAKTKQR